MTGILSSISSLISSILATIQGILGSILSAVQGAGALVVTSLGAVTDFARGLLELVLGNIVLIGIVIAAFVGWTAYAQRRGQTVQGSAVRGKKTL